MKKRVTLALIAVMMLAFSLPVFAQTTDVVSQPNRHVIGQYLILEDVAIYFSIDDISFDLHGRNGELNTQEIANFIADNTQQIVEILRASNSSMRNSETLVLVPAGTDLTATTRTTNNLTAVQTGMVPSLSGITQNNADVMSCCHFPLLIAAQIPVHIGGVFVGWIPGWICNTCGAMWI